MTRLNEDYTGYGLPVNEQLIPNSAIKTITCIIVMCQMNASRPFNLAHILFQHLLWSDIGVGWSFFHETIAQVIEFGIS